MGLNYLLRRLFVMIPVFFAVVTVVFFMIRFAPGGPFDSEKQVPPDILKNLQAKYHMDEPLYMQYFRYLGDLAQGDLGPSFKYANRTVNELIFESLPVSAELGLMSLVWALMIGLVAGGLAASKPNTFWDYFPMGVSIVGICLPTFVIGPLGQLIFAIKIPEFFITLTEAHPDWANVLNPLREAITLPVSGWGDGVWKTRVLPSLTLGFAFAAYISRLTRGGLMEIRSQDFIRTARAKGLTETQILVKHSLRGGLLPVVSYLGPALAGIISGALVTEQIFAIPGLGKFFIQGALNRDYTLVMGTSLVYFSLIFVCNFLVDIVYVVLDPRVRYE